MKDAPFKEMTLLLAGLSLFAWPLFKLTSKTHNEATPALNASELEASQSMLEATLMVKSAHPFQWVELRQAGTIIAHFKGPETEGEVDSALDVEQSLFTIAAQFPKGTPETALELEIWVEGFPDKTLNFWVENKLLEEVEVHFHE